jgi:hypothetical protein
VTEPVVLPARVHDPAYAPETPPEDMFVPAVY